MSANDSVTDRPPAIGLVIARGFVPWIMFVGSIVLSLVAAAYVAGNSMRWATSAAVAGVGLVLSFVLFQVTRAEVRSRNVAEESAAALRKSQEAVTASEQRFRTLFEQSPLSIQIFAPDGRCVLANRAWEQLWGRKAEEVADYNILDNPQRAAAGSREDISRAFAGEAVSLPAACYDSAATGKAGTTRWVSVQLYPVQNAEDRVLEVVLVHQDVTERKEAEEERAHLLDAEREARNQAEAANRTKDEFLATLSHELRTPLNAILGWTQLMRMGGMEGEEFQHALETIERNSRVQAQLVEDLLDLSRIITGKLKLELQLVEFPGVAEAALDSVRPTASAKGVRLVPVLDSHATPVLGDPNRLQQVIWNLLSNAIKFTPKGGTVEVFLNRVDSQAELVIADTGAGISPEFLPHIFERLRQADSSSTRRHGGLGLGLAITRHLVELHGGTIRASSGGAEKGPPSHYGCPWQPSAS